jgi:hypothetical protein
MPREKINAGLSTSSDAPLCSRRRGWEGFVLSRPKLDSSSKRRVLNGAPIFLQIVGSRKSNRLGVALKGALQDYFQRWLYFCVFFWRQCPVQLFAFESEQFFLQGVK